MNRNVRKLLTVVLCVVFVISTALLLRQFRDNSGGSEAYDVALEIALNGGKREKEAGEETVPEQEAEALAWVPEPVEDDENMQTLADMDLDALREVNPDVIGWIYVPDSRINYPLLQGEDNEYYLKHTWEDKANSVGAIFLECMNSPDMTDFNTIVYGHNMNDGSMFAGLRRYSAQWYWERHPYVYVATDEGVFRYEVFSSYKADVDSNTYGLSFNQMKTRADFLIMALENSQIDTGIVPEMTDRILTLSTCSGAGYSTRWVVHARLKMVEQVQS